MLLLIVFAFTALFFSFLCSIAEAVMLSVRRPFVEKMAKEGSRAGKILQNLQGKIHEPLAAILTLNTIANTVGATGVGAQAAVVYGNAYLGIVSGILTLLILVFSEIIPKTIGAVYWRQLAPYIAFYLKYLVMFLYPFVILSQYLTGMLTPKSAISGLSRDEFSAMADLGQAEGQLDANESRILKNLFRFNTTTVADIMTPSTVVFSLPADMTVAEYCTVHEGSPFSRIPIFTELPDHVTGFVLRTEILLAQANDRHEITIGSFQRDIRAIPDQQHLSRLFTFLMEQRMHMALVVDEYGSLEGLVTMEDLIETLIGLEIVDEEDKVTDMRVLARRLWRRRAGRMGLDLDE